MIIKEGNFMRPAGLRERKKARTHDQISEVAQQLFARQGYNETTLEEIAAAADVHKRTLLRYFPSKTHLVLHRYMRLLEEFRTAVSARGKTPVLDIWKQHVLENAGAIARRGDKMNMANLVKEVPDLQREIILVQFSYQQIIQRELEVDYPRVRNRELITHVASAALVGGNFSLSATLQGRRQFSKFDESLLQIIDFVRKDILKE